MYKHIFCREGDYLDRHKLFKRVGTHHGRFHADEVMATAILKEIFDLEVIRTRDIETLNTLDIVYDVGGGEFDHHMSQKKYRENGIPYAACGLIWNRYGKDVILSRNSSLKEEDISSVLEYIDTVLIQGIDALDNGVKLGDALVITLNISSIISGFNPPWDSDMQEDSSFYKAVDFAGIVLGNVLKQKLSVIAARDNVVRAYKNRISPDIMVLDISCPWGQILQEIDTKEEVLFVVDPGREEYVVHTVRKQGKAGKTRKDLPLLWAGRRDTELQEVTGTEDAIFCHTGRFMAVAGSLESALKMAGIAVLEPPDEILKRLLWRLKKLLSLK